MGFLDSITKYAPGVGAITGVASTVGGLLGSIGQGKRQRKNMDYQYELNKRMYEQQRDDNLLMYQRQLADQRELIADERAYNDFSSVAARARKAGVNPLAVFGNGGVGIQSSAGSTPSYNAPNAGSSSIPGVDSIGANLISGGATISNIIRESAMLSEQQRLMKAQADKAEIEAKFAERGYIADIENKEMDTLLKEAKIGTETEIKRLTWLKGNMQEILNENQGNLSKMQILRLCAELDLFERQIRQLDITNSYQAESIEAQLLDVRTRVYATLEDVAQKWHYVSQNAKQLNLTEEQINEAKRANRKLESLKETMQTHEIAYDKKRFTADMVFKSVGSLTDIAAFVAKFINPLSALAKDNPSLAQSWTDSGYIFAE